MEREARIIQQEPDRVLATVLFTDIVGSTNRASDLGNAAWLALLEQHHALIRRRLGQFYGEEIDIAGDGFFAAFGGPRRAIESVRAHWYRTFARSGSRLVPVFTPGSAS